MKTLVCTKTVWLVLASLVTVFLAIKCQSPDDISAPIVNSLAVSEITETSAVVAGAVFFDGGTKILEQGIYLDENKRFPVAASSPNFTVTISNLLPGTSYSVRAYAVNSAGISYGSSLEFSTLNLPPIIDTTVLDTSFYLADVEMIDVAVDGSGNVYITGTFLDSSLKNDAVVAKFNADGQIIWRQNIVTDNYDRPRGGLVVSNNILYVHVGCNDEDGTGGGQLFVSAYDCESGNLSWSQQVGAGLGNDLVVSTDGFIYSVAAARITKLDLAGNIISQFFAQGAYAFSSISLYGDNQVFVGGSATVVEGSEPMIWCFNAKLQLLWDNPGTKIDLVNSVSALASFPENNLLLASEVEGNPLQGTPYQSYLICYRVEADTLELQWKKQFDNSLHLRFKVQGDNCYVYSSDYNFQNSPQGPILINLQGEVLWASEKKVNGNMAFVEKIYVASGDRMLLMMILI